MLYRSTYRDPPIHGDLVQEVHRHVWWSLVAASLLLLAANIVVVFVWA